MEFVNSISVVTFIENLYEFLLDIGLN